MRMVHTLLRQTLRLQLQVGKEKIFADFIENGRLAPLFLGLRRLLDRLLKQAWYAIPMPPSCTLVAVGGYGRGELFPYSDIDVLILVADTMSADDKAHIEAFVRLCWDASIEISSSVRTVSECIDQANHDITIQTALLEPRRIAGNAVLFNLLCYRYHQSLDARAFFLAKQQEMVQRHARYEYSPYSLEPNCKESPGGLRDLQVILWMAQAAGLGESWKTLFENGFLTQHTLRELVKSNRILKTIRAHLHLIAQRQQDVLRFDLQPTLAQRMAFTGADIRKVSEQLMHKYYCAAKVVTQLNTILILNLEEKLFPSIEQNAQPLGVYFCERQGLIDLVREDIYQTHPYAILETFWVYTQTPGIRGLSARTLDALYHARNQMHARWRRDPVNQMLFISIIQAPHGVTRALRLMNQLSILGAYLPSFRRIVGQMQHDLFHVYTVDQHILMVIRNVRRFTMTEHHHEFPLCSQLISQFERPWVLVIAALFHDIAKGQGGDHSHLGARLAKQFCHQHGLAETDCQLISWLVEHHLSMSRVAQKEDFSESRVILRFTHLVKDQRTLTALYLLTVADMCGTSPKVWSAWKGKLLEDLYYIALNTLSRTVPNNDTQVMQRKNASLEILREYGLTEATQKTLWAQLDNDFFLHHDTNQIAWLSQYLCHHVTSNAPIVKAREASFGGGIEVLVYISDQADLFVRLCAYFAQKNITILQAKIYTTLHGYALDTFQVTDSQIDIAHQQPGHTTHEMIETELSKQLTQPDYFLPRIVSRSSRQSRSFPLQTQVTLQADTQHRYVHLTVCTSDRTGLLYCIAQVLAQHKISLHMARINTLGERAEDIFLLDGQTLQDKKQQAQLKTDLLTALSSQ